MPMTTNVVSSNPVQAKCTDDKVWFVSDLQQVSGFSPSIPIYSTNKTDYHDITEILLKVVLSTITHTTHPM